MLPVFFSVATIKFWQPKIPKNSKMDNQIPKEKGWIGRPTKVSLM
jgi:hypothetical protein